MAGNTFVKENRIDIISDALVNGSRSNVFFTKDISVKGLLEIYSHINRGMK
jgi:hypothetical protein